MLESPVPPENFVLVIVQSLPFGRQCDWRRLSLNRMDLRLSRTHQSSLSAVVAQKLAETLATFAYFRRDMMPLLRPCGSNFRCTTDNLDPVLFQLSAER